MATPTNPDNSSQGHQHYLVYGQRLCSTLPLPELPRAEFDVRDMIVRAAPNQISDLTSIQAHVLTRCSTNLDCDLSLYETTDGILLRWEDHCDFLLSQDGRIIRCRPGPSINLGWVQSTLYGMVFSYALHLMGVRNLHSSAVALPSGAIGFLADPESGKSTMAAVFARAGYPFLTDDVLALQKNGQGYTAYPGFPSVSLSAKSIRGLPEISEESSRVIVNEEKQRVVVDGRWASFQLDPVPLSGLFVLRRSKQSASVTLERLPRVDAIRSLLENTNCIPILPAGIQRLHMEFISQLTANIPVWRLTYPTGFEHTPRVIQKVVSEVGKGSQTQQ